MQMLPEEVERGQEVLKRYRARCAELKAEGQVRAWTGPKQLPCFWLSAA